MRAGSRPSGSVCEESRPNASIHQVARDRDHICIEGVTASTILLTLAILIVAPTWTSLI